MFVVLIRIATLLFAHHKIMQVGLPLAAGIEIEIFYNANDVISFSFFSLRLVM